MKRLLQLTGFVLGLLTCGFACGKADRRAHGQERNARAEP